MSASLIGWIITALIVLLIIYNIIVGLVRGFGKATFRLIWLVVFGVVVLFITPSLTKVVNGIDVSMLNLNINGEVIYISDIGLNLLDMLANMNQVFATSTTLRALVETLPAIVVSLPVFVLAFLAVKWILWPVWAIIASSIFDRQKKAKKRFEKEQKQYAKDNPDAPPLEMPIELAAPKKKNRLGGAVIGLVTGLVVCMAVFMPLVGLNAIYQNVASVEVTNENNEKVSLIESVIGGDSNVAEYISCYENSVASKILTYTGVGVVSNAMFGYLTTTNVNDERISISTEISNAAKVYDNVITLMEFRDGELTQAKLDKTLTAAKEILIKAKSSNLINVLGDDIIPLFLNDFFSNEDFYIIDGGDFDALIKDSYSAYVRRFNTQDLENQLENLVDVLITLNGSDLILPFVNHEISGLDAILNHIGTNIVKPYNFTTTIINKLFDVTILKNSYPRLLETGVKTLIESLGEEYETNSISADDLKVNLNTLLTNLVDFSRHYASAENMVFKNTTQAFICLGNAVDILKQNILSPANFDTLLTFATDYAKTAVKGLANFTPNEQTHIDTIINSVTYIENWGNTVDEEGEPVLGELYSLSTLYSSIAEIGSAGLNVDKLLEDSEKNTYLADVGSGIRSAILGNSKIITNANLRRLFEIIFTRIKSTSNTGVADMLNSVMVYVQGGTQKTLENYILDNIYIYSNPNAVTITADGWRDEFLYNVEILKKGYKVFSNGYTVAQLSTLNVLNDLGKQIDNAIKTTESVPTPKTKLIFSNATIRGVLYYYLEPLSNRLGAPQEVLDILNKSYYSSASVTIRDKILSNVYNPDGTGQRNISWEDEFAQIKTLLNANFNTSDLTKLGKILDGVLYSNVISRDVINSVVEDYLIQELRKFSFYENSTIQLGVSEMTNKLRASSNGPISYEAEFGYLKGIVDVILAEYGNTRDMLTAIGWKFNDAVNANNIPERGKSVILTRTALNAFLTYYFDDFISSKLVDSVPDDGVDEYADLKQVIETIKTNNIPKIRDYQLELINIYNLLEAFSAPQSDDNYLRNIGSTLDAIKPATSVNDANTSASRLFDVSAVRAIIVYFINDKTSSITQDSNPGLYAIIRDVVTKAEDTNVVIQSYQTEFSHLKELSSVLTSALDYSKLGDALNHIRAKVSGYTASMLISQPIVDNLIKYYFDDFVTSANFNATDDSELLEVINDVGSLTNIANIINYKTELIKLNTLFTEITRSGATASSIAHVLDASPITPTTAFFTNAHINAIVVAYFNKQAKSYESEYADIIEAMRTKLKARTNTYGQSIDDLMDVLSSFTTLNAINSLNDFSADLVTQVGGGLDRMEGMTTICDATIAKMFAQKLIDKLKTFINSEFTDEDVIDAMIDGVDNVLNGSVVIGGNSFTFAFTIRANGEPWPTTYNGVDTYCGTSYYIDLLTQLRAVVNP